ncbi:MAG: DUF3267 domain-containing protein [Parafannyhessea sp.]|uniref:DUF3267 domain-containing protein n=1 Tax=Parafannyhessea sp. TaxID=2847324 RepID=UPI003F1211B3
MRVMSKVDVLGDADFQRRMLRLSWWILGVGLALGLVAWVLSLAGVAPLVEKGIGLGWLLVLFLASVVALPVHELVHAAAFVLLGGRGVHVSFGFKDYMLYTSANGATLSRRRFEAVLLAPTVVLTLAFAAAGAAFGVPLLAWACAVFHLAGCTGDLCMAAAIWREPTCAFVRDAPYGADLLGR